MTQIEIVYAMARALVGNGSGASVLVAKGSHWPAADPVVLANPQLFSADPRWGLQYSVEPDGWDDPVGGSVETATATPGEKRSVSRRG